ncbi:hypothetical protein [Cryptosporangium sp. NPDC051539]|uniref:hypothetical protein n=1 Tax=Cryptosporangium sp. NPDC051539 TaxID=3363962 RepID=UPI0037B28D7C
MIAPPVDRFHRSVGRLTTLLSYWTPPRFSAAASPLVEETVASLGVRSRTPVDDARRDTVGDNLQAVAQVFADLAADAEGRPRRPVPRLPDPGVLADQLVVLGADVVAAGLEPNVLDDLTARLDTLRASL